MIILNPINFPLNEGISLIEASAGTGKTFTISLLYLRLLLGLGKNNAYHRPLSVEEILVVTFTESATIELRNRIADHINQLLQLCINKNPQNIQINTLLKVIKNPLDAAKLLNIAKQNINKASIFTIHSFCQKMLHFYAFESKKTFEMEFIENEDSLLQEAIIDFWHRYFYTLNNIDIVNLIKKEWNSPDELLEVIKPWIYRSNISILNSSMMDNETINSRHHYNVTKIQQMKYNWQKYGDVVERIINGSNIDKRCYNKKYLLIWLNLINNWSNSLTYNYSIPKELKKFTQITLNNKTKLGGKIPTHQLFYDIQIFINQNFSLKDIIIYQALVEVRKYIDKKKHSCSLIGFNDLLNMFSKKLEDLSFLNKLRKRFPVAMIDEFQDTDQLQYDIFYKIYNNQSKNFLLLIGDPKQSIYSFRGSDIFTYINARNQMNKFYELNINWRSSTSMVHSINTLFSKTKYPFIFQDIPFIRVDSTIENQKLSLIINNAKQHSLNFWIQPGEMTSLKNYYHYMSTQCAIHIKKLLYSSSQKQAFLINNKHKRLVYASDIVILVRNYYEATLIYNSLKSLSIASVYLSSDETIYNTIEAKETLWLLKAIIYPTKNDLLRRALSTSFFSLNASLLEELINNHKMWCKLSLKFIKWNKLWLKYNVSTMLNNVIKQHNIAKKFLTSSFGKIKLSKFYYLIEILQKFSIHNKNPYELIRFLEKQILNPNTPIINKYFTLENHDNTIKIISIHKSKGLQYPIVWIPFSAAFRKTSTAMFYDRKECVTTLDLQCNTINLEIADTERLSEDLRLLYVALTRAIFHCNIGISPIFIGKTKQIISSKTHLHFSAIGYLLQNGKPMSSYELNNSLMQLEDETKIKVIKKEIFLSEIETYEICDKNNIMLQTSYRKLSSKIKKDWQVINLNNKIFCKNQCFRSDLLVYDLHSDIQTKQTSILNHQQNLDFIKFDNFLHNLLSNIKFSNCIDIQWFKIKLIEFGYSQKILFFIIKLIKNIICTKLHENNLTLNLLKNDNIIINFDFVIHINKKINICDLNKIINSYYESRYLQNLNLLQNSKGILEGKIDLIFQWQNKYYLLDYKLDYLGNKPNAYQHKMISLYMMQSKYYLQCHFYSIALHRYLKLRISDYNYDNHFGGIFYLFIQKISNTEGVFSFKPPYELIEHLDKILI